jgi:hypothetical protein
LGAAFFFGVSAAAVLVFLNGNWRFIGFGIVAIVAAFLSWVLQVDADLIEAIRLELGQDYIIASRYWIVGAVVIAITFLLMLRNASRSSCSGQSQEAEQVGSSNGE